MLAVGDRKSHGTQARPWLCEVRRDRPRPGLYGLSLTLWRRARMLLAWIPTAHLLSLLGPGARALEETNCMDKSLKCVDSTAYVEGCQTGLRWGVQ